MARKRPIKYADDDTYSVRALVLLRVPSLILGLLLGVVISFMTSRFEEVLSQHIEVAFFIPFVVYMADAVGTQTQTIYARDLRTGTARFKNYLFKEAGIGLTMGIIFGLASAIVVLLWFGSEALSVAVGLSMFATVFSAPLVALLVTEALQLERQDPAVGAGPIATVIQDTVSVLLYGLIASAVILG